MKRGLVGRTVLLMLLFAVISSVAAYAQELDARTYIALSVGSKVTVDGNLSDWQVAGKFVVPAVVLNAKEQAVRGDTAWQSTQDSSAHVYLRWTQNHLLVAADVVDDIGALGGKIDNGDSVGVGIIADGIHFLVEMTPYPVDSDWSQASLLRSWKGSFSRLPFTTVVRATVKADGKGYYLEAAIPWSDLRLGEKSLNPLTISQATFNVILTDADTNKSRKSVLINTRSANNPVTTWYSDSKEFLPLILSGDGAGTVAW